MKISSIKKLKEKLQLFNILIFDLDDTIFMQSHYDNPALKNVSKFLSKILDLNSTKIFLDLRKLKKLKRGKHPLLVFDKYLKKKISDNKKLNSIIKKSVKIFQSYNCDSLNKAPSLKKLIIDLSKQKTLFLVTNGNLERQKRKIKHLNLNSFFKKIFILDGVKKKTKPNIVDVKYLVNYLKKKKLKKATYIGDNVDTDKEFAKNLNIRFINFEFNGY
ncbi:HAD hydrolase-like protein [Candidatus Pelagibacter sp.]|jgi:putative hydrolase of the HAD superfamily|nr:HAD hydrolase-like protein [Candidatus Pelagibacter sp.]